MMEPGKLSNGGSESPKKGLKSSFLCDRLDKNARRDPVIPDMLFYDKI